jgi:aminoglycoside phosphotransferase (APT) family kinase protein
MMNPPWRAEHEIDLGRARSLIDDQFPELAAHEIEALSEGWDNVAVLVGKRWVFRFPRRAIAIGLIEREARALPIIAPRVPFPVPIPCFVGKPGEKFPAPFSGYLRLEGRSGCSVPYDDASRFVLASQIARFLRALHNIEPRLVEEQGVGGDELRRTDVSLALDRVRTRLEPLKQGPYALLVRDALVIMQDQAEALRGEEDAAATTLVHGDLYGRHLLLDDSGRLSGVIDWGDVHLGDPALDLAIAHSFLPPEAHRLFLSEYGYPGRGCWARARFRAIHHSASLIAYGADKGDSRLIALASRTFAWMKRSRIISG